MATEKTEPTRANVEPPMPTRGASAWRRVRAWGPWLLGLSVAVRLAWAYLTPHGADLVDLHVYVSGPATLGHGNLYEFTYPDKTPDFPLPFTYPPFAAVVFWPLHLIPFTLLGLCWILGTIAALYAVVRLSQRLLGFDDARAAAVWTAVTMWTEPVRSTLDYGQINVLLMLLILLAVASSRWWISGTLIGLAGGVKLTPLVSGLYFLGARRWTTAIWAGVVFLLTVVVGIAVVGEQGRYYFTDLLGKPDRIGPIATVFNQSWRGGISRILGHDAGSGVLVLFAYAVTAILAFLAWRAVNDRLGQICVVEMFGLLISPISWTHHWVWMVPFMVWLLHGPWRDKLGAKVFGCGWLVLLLIGVPWLLSFAQPDIWRIDRPWPLAWAGLVDIVAAIATLTWMAVVGRRSGHLGRLPWRHV
ncbi:mannosyltransferase [Mycobacteroides abscessus]|uniref:Alpha-(1-2)-phosphatidylinositol pentamannoside mannosyltransferase n=1 Tax=Mycobacteroides abscessus 21 TaxID=1299324 RepID=A0A829Q6T7_9MYCO|nr:mannosyltransferase [Mycobacteroides abscessus]EUA48355.1 alpha-(1-2)-phosphatidylinositol pentamannoside mannosyltransferase [Mycobacteroides abscessus 21]MDO3214429.1 mannosyltransferase [Mycobacteroides abscessus subsp. abscessus]SLL32304.1 polyprenol-phosphate-mannose-dependent alpha-(1-2)-phosphatidylinositol pentamannoside mannosyltransferase [Mycobacteroides abscessus subsp. abscessus]